MRWRRWLVIGIAFVVTIFSVAMAAWSVAIGPDAVWRVLTHGTTTVWDHLDYPGRDTTAAPTPRPWPTGRRVEPMVTLEGVEQPIDEVLTARDLARFGQLVLDDGMVDGDRLLPDEWLADSFAPAYSTERWPADYDGTALTNYGYQWWLAGDDAVVALGKDGQYLYVDRTRDLVIVRTGTSQGGIGWVDLLVEIAEDFPKTSR